MVACQGNLQIEFWRECLLRRDPQSNCSQELREVWQVKGAILDQTWKEKGQEKKRWSLVSSNPQKTRAEEISGLNSWSLALIDSLLSTASQQIKECLNIILLNQTNENQKTLGWGVLKKFQVDPRWKDLDFWRNPSNSIRLRRRHELTQRRLDV